MKLFKYWLPMTAVAFGFVSSVQAAHCQNDSFHNETRQRDYEAVQEFVNSKRTIPLEEKDCNLSISGDVRFVYAYIDESINDNDLRDGNGNGFAQQETTPDNPNRGNVFYTPDQQPVTPVGYSNNNFEIEFNLYFDYICDRAWAVAWLQFDQDAGIFTNLSCADNTNRYAPQGLFGSGCCDDLCLRKAYLGYNLCADGCQRIDIELGRRPLYNVFDSRIQFQQNFDGALLRYSRNLDCWGDFYWNFGFFVVDERADNYGLVTELGLLNAFGSFCGQGLDLKYSYIDWKSLVLGGDKNRCKENNPLGHNFRVSQFTASYAWQDPCFCLPWKFYGAFLVNTEGKKRDFLANHRANQAWYLGFIVNQVCREGDWALDFNWQYVGAQAVPDSDFGGVGANGNNLLGRNHFDDISTSGTGANARGFTNVQGFQLEGLYALTDNLSINGLVEWATDIHSDIGGEHDYVKVQFSAIYSF